MQETDHIKLSNAVPQNEDFFIANGLFDLNVVAQILKFPHNSRKGKNGKDK